MPEAGAVKGGPAGPGSASKPQTPGLQRVTCPSNSWGLGRTAHRLFAPRVRGAGLDIIMRRVPIYSAGARAMVAVSGPQSVAYARRAHTMITGRREAECLK